MIAWFPAKGGRSSETSFSLNSGPEILSDEMYVGMGVGVGVGVGVWATEIGVTKINIAPKNVH